MGSGAVGEDGKGYWVVEILEKWMAPVYVWDYVTCEYRRRETLGRL